MSSSNQSQIDYLSVISAEECMEIVRNTKQFEKPSIVDYTLDKIPGHIGFLGEYLQLKVTVEDNGVHKCQCYFLKSLPQADKNRREMMEELGFFRKESQVYSKIFTSLGHNQEPSKWRPECYLVRDDLIVLEDLKWRYGYSMVHYKKPLESTYLHLVLEAVAQMHAVSLNYEFNVVGGQRLDDLYSDILFETSVSQGNSWFMAGLSAIKAIALNGTKYCKSSTKKQLIQRDLDTKLRQIFDVVKPTTEFQNVLVHRDIWHNNLMFRFEKDPITGDNIVDCPKSCVLLDFQICRYLPPVIDVLLTIYLTTRRSHREQFLDDYLKFYHKTLSSKLRQFDLDPEKVLNWEQLQRSLGHYKIIGHVFACVYLALTNIPENVLDDLNRDDPELYHQYCNVNRDEFVLKYLRDDEFYRETMVECVEEALEYFFGF
ncbi:uncharacterized protein LOC131679228 [Topomyia yanbarensis]|uniref:uncharacterized protein LOC131679228 n=1 Tax=Topomyia yanbarensis TaxID=2498891 RepID=UPI00273AC40C|nr:uncharacterized protein LOC131679228 [Topomyia yanbarensis]